MMNKWTKTSTVGIFFKQESHGVGLNQTFAIVKLNYVSYDMIGWESD